MLSYGRRGIFNDSERGLSVIDIDEKAMLIAVRTGVIDYTSIRKLSPLEAHRLFANLEDSGYIDRE